MAGWSDEWRRAAALGSVIATNVAMLVWFRVGTRALRQHAGNRSFAWLLAALGVACGLVLAVTPLTRQFGLPVTLPLQWAGLASIGIGLAATLALRRQARATAST